MIVFYKGKTNTKLDYKSILCLAISALGTVILHSR